MIFIFSYLGFGMWILSKLKIATSTLQTLLFSLFVSIAVITTTIAFLGPVLGTQGYYLLFVTGSIGITQYKKILDFFKKVGQAVVKNKLIIALLVLSMFALSSTMILSTTTIDGDLKLQETHDSVWHIALMENLQKTIPPEHPSQSTIILNNYHYLYDLFLSSFLTFSNVSSYTLYFQYSVLFLSGLLVLSAYEFARAIHSKFAGVVLALTTVFTGSFAYLIPYFNPIQGWHESSFWVSQTFVMIVNPQVIYTLALTLMCLLLFYKISLGTPLQKNYLALHLVTILLCATSIGFKSYSWVILSVLYASVLLIELIRHKSFTTIMIGVGYLLFCVPLLWLITKFAGNTFFYHPLWFTNSMIESPDRVNYLQWKFLQDHYVLKKNIPRLFLLEAKKIAIFYFGNLGIRSFFIFLPLVFILKKTKQHAVLTVSLFAAIGFVFSSVFPLLFLQTGTVWNSIQFWYYALLFANILFTFFVVLILEKKSKLLTAVLVSALLFLALPTTIHTLQAKTKSPTLFAASKKEFLSSLQKSDTVLICPQADELYHTSIVTTLTPAKVYLANPSQLALTGLKTNTQEEYEKIFTNQDASSLKNIIESHSITTIMCSDPHLITITQTMLEEAYGTSTIVPTFVSNLAVFQL